MEIVVHYPTDENTTEALKVKMAEAYSEAVKNYINNLEFTKKDKIKLLDQTIKSQKIN